MINTYWQHGDKTTKVRAIVDNYVIHCLTGGVPIATRKGDFLTLFEKIDPPVRRCKCGCGAVISVHSPPNKVFKNDKHKARYHMRKRGGFSAREKTLVE